LISGHAYFKGKFNVDISYTVHICSQVGRY
jgi:hypothetical protein